MSVITPQANKLSPSEIGKRVFEARTAKGLSQEALGKACGLSQNGIGKIEAGRIGKSRYVADIWQFLGLDLAELGLGGSLASNGIVHTVTEVDVLVHMPAAIFERVTIEHVSYDAGKRGIMFTMQFRSGELIRGVLDASMLVASAKSFLEKAEKLGLDVKSLLDDRPK